MMLFVICPSIWPQDRPSPSPLNEPEKRRILSLLHELKACRLETGNQSEFIAREIDLYKQEKANWEQAIANEKKATELARKEADLNKELAGIGREQMEFYKSALAACTARRGFGCTLLKIITLGLSGCR